jgi:hypothetical protein
MDHIPSPGSLGSLAVKEQMHERRDVADEQGQGEGVPESSLSRARKLDFQ